MFKENFNYQSIIMDRKEFIQLAGASAGWMLISSCLNGCSKSEVSPAPTGVDFTIDVSTGPLATNGGSINQGGIIVARTLAGSFIAVSAACTHEGTTVQFQSASSSFYCPNHGARFSSTGSVTNGPATKALTQYKTTLTGTSLKVTS
jgi:cytochrome b6-f complex iron-sulfur subunit